jgi:hypothetical protein
VEIPKKGGRDGSSRKFPQRCGYDRNSGEGEKIQKITAKETERFREHSVDFREILP